MPISQTAEYALRAIICLADDPACPQTTQEIAKITKIPSDYLSKIMRNLRRAGMVSARRGVNGGFVLSELPTSISVLKVINAIDPIQRITSCPLKLDSHGLCLCPLHHKLDQAIETMEKAFGSCTIADLLKASSKVRPLREKTRKPSRPRK